MNAEMVWMILSLSASGTLVAALLVIVRLLLRRRLNRTWQYYAWLFVFARLLLPFAPQENLMGFLFRSNFPQLTVGEDIPFSFPQAGTKGNGVFLEAVPEGEGSVIGNGLLEEAFSAKSAVMNLDTLVVCLWAAVAAGMLFYRAASCARLVRRLKRDGTLCTEGEAVDVCREACQKRGLKNTLPLYRNPHVGTPMLAGIFHPFLVLPEVEWTYAQLNGILAHELTHFTRLDIAYQWIVQLAVCLHWFNPVVRWAARQAARDCEISCDEVVLHGLDEPGRRAYGDALLACVRPKTIHGALMMSEDARLLKERLGEIMKFNGTKKGTAVLAALLTVVLCGCSVASGVYTPSPKTAEEFLVADNVMYEPNANNSTSSTYPADGVAGKREVLYEQVPQKSAEPRELVLKMDGIPTSTVFEGTSDSTLWLYGSTKLTVSTSQEKQNGKIIDYMEVKLPGNNSDRQSGEPQRYAVLRIPQGYYSGVTIHGLESGMSLTRLRTIPLTITASGCALSLPGDSQKPVSALLEDCSGAIGFTGRDVAEMNTLKIVSEDSALGLPPQWNKIESGQKEYTRGSGAVPIFIHIKGCAFSVNLNLGKEETEVYLPSKLED